MLAVRRRWRGNRMAQLGQAVHRVLEWSCPTSLRPGKQVGAEGFVGLCQAACVEVGLTPGDALEVEACARRVFDSKELERFLVGGEWLWAGNEVPVGDATLSLRIDRLVALDVGGRPEWWVLDYKLDSAPESNPEYRAKLGAYCRIVSRMEPGCTVRGALVSGEGSLRVVDWLEVAATNREMVVAAEV